MLYINLENNWTFTERLAIQLRVSLLVHGWVWMLPNPGLSPGFCYVLIILSTGLSAIQLREYMYLLAIQLRVSILVHRWVQMPSIYTVILCIFLRFNYTEHGTTCYSISGIFGNLLKRLDIQLRLLKTGLGILDF